MNVGWGEGEGGGLPFQQIADDTGEDRQRQLSEVAAAGVAAGGGGGGGGGGSPVTGHLSSSILLLRSYLQFRCMKYLVFLVIYKIFLYLLGVQISVFDQIHWA